MDTLLTGALLFEQNIAFGVRHLISKHDQPITQETIMKKSTRDQAKGTFHQIKGRIKEVAGKLSDNPKLEIEGKSENIAGKVQVKSGQIKKVLGK